MSLIRTSNNLSLQTRIFSSLLALSIAAGSPISAFAFGPFGNKDNKEAVKTEESSNATVEVESKTNAETDATTKTTTKTEVKTEVKAETSTKTKPEALKKTAEKNTKKAPVEKVQQANEQILEQKQTQAPVATVKKDPNVVFSTGKTEVVLNDFANTSAAKIDLGKVGESDLEIQLNNKTIKIEVSEWTREAQDAFQDDVESVEDLSKDIAKAVKKCDTERFNENFNELVKLQQRIENENLAAGAKQSTLWQRVRQATQSQDEALYETLAPAQKLAVMASNNNSITLNNDTLLFALLSYNGSNETGAVTQTKTLQQKNTLFNQAINTFYWEALNGYASQEIENTVSTVEANQASCPIAIEKNPLEQKTIAQKTPLQFVVLANDDTARTTLSTKLGVEPSCLAETPKGAVSILSIDCPLQTDLKLEELQKASTPVGKTGWFDTGLPRQRFSNNAEVKITTEGQLASVKQAYAQMQVPQIKETNNESKVMQTMTSNRPVTVALIGSGIDTANPALAGALWVNPREIAGNNQDDDGNGYVDDISGWNFNANTSVINNPNGADTLSAVLTSGWKNNTGISGLNPNAVIMPVRVEDQNGTTNSIKLAQAIRYAVDNGAQIIQISTGGELESWIEPAAVQYAVNKGILILSAAGDDKKAVSTLYPTALDGVLTVAAVDGKNNHLQQSNWGKPVALAAPNGTLNNKYGTLTGSLFATSLTTGAASILLEDRPVLSNDDIRQLLVYSAKDIDAPGIDQYTGSGLINLTSAIKADPNFFLNAEIAGIRPKETDNGYVLEVIGTADADQFKNAWLEYRAQVEGTQEAEWQKAPFNVESATRNGVLGAIPVELVEGSSSWTLRVMTEHQNGETREGRYILKLQ